MKDIFSYIKEEESSYQTIPVQVSEGWEWSMWKHLKLTILYKNFQLETGKNDNKPVKNITLPILRLQYRSEGFDIKDIVLFVNSSKNYFKSFLIKKYHEKWARKNEIDTFIDEMVESYVDYGGALVKNINKIKPEVVPLQRLAFCDQTDILSGTICEKHNYSPDQLKEMENKHWGDKKYGATGTIDDVIRISQNKKKENNSMKESKTPNKYIEVYEVHGMFPEWCLTDYSGNEEYENKYTRQLHIITFYPTEEGKKGICLYKGKEKEHPYKLILRDKIYNRALGMGGAEELFEAQVWTTYDAIRIKGMLDAVSKILYQTADESFANRNKTDNLDHGEILVHKEGKPLTQINTYSPNIALFERSINDWEIHARMIGAAQEAIMGDQPPSGTPFKSVEFQATESHSLHEYRKGKLATFIDEIYRDWVIPYLSREIMEGQEFLAELDLEELQAISDTLVVNETNKMIKDRILNGELIYPDEIDKYKQIVKDEFAKGGSKRFIEIIKDEFKNAPIDVYVNIVGKQKNLAGIVDKLTNIFKTIMVNPAILQNPPMAKLFNSILEASGLDSIDFSGFKIPPPTLPKVAEIQQAEPAMPAIPAMAM